jgi:hypothetical protein
MYNRDEFERKVAALPAPLVAAVRRTQGGTLHLCEEVLLAVWVREPRLFGAGAAEMLVQIAGRAPAARIERVLQATRSAAVSGVQWPTPSPQIRRVMLDERVDPAGPLSILRALEADSWSLLRLCAGTIDLAQKASRDPLLVVASGASAGCTAPLVAGVPFGVGRDPSYSGLREGGLSVCDHTIPRWLDGVAPLSMTLGPEGVSFALTRKSAWVGRGVQLSVEEMARDPSAAQITSAAARSIPLGPEGLSLFYGSTLFVLAPPPAVDARPAPPPAPAARTTEAVATILFLGANPSNTARLALAREVQEIKRRLRSARLGDRFRVVEEWVTRPEELDECLLRHGPSIVHFSGHGDPMGALLMEDEAGAEASVDPRALAEMFRILRRNIRCVVLNACYSEAQAQAIAEHIDCVVGMNSAIADRSAIAFVGALYQALGYGESVRTSFELGCARIRLRGLAHNDVPVLLGRSGVDLDKLRLFETSEG